MNNAFINIKTITKRELGGYFGSPVAYVFIVIFLLLTGVPGFIAFLSVNEWPARESCPSCGKRRVVTREKCEHCGAPFAPPQKAGIEIFESRLA